MALSVKLQHNVKSCPWNNLHNGILELWTCNVRALKCMARWGKGGLWGITGKGPNPNPSPRREEDKELDGYESLSFPVLIMKKREKDLFVLFVLSFVCSFGTIFLHVIGVNFSIQLFQEMFLHAKNIFGVQPDIPKSSVFYSILT